jgi:hypothetical protein
MTRWRTFLAETAVLCGGLALVLYGIPLIAAAFGVPLR